MAYCQEYTYIHHKFKRKNQQKLFYNLFYNNVLEQAISILAKGGQILYLFSIQVSSSFKKLLYNPKKMVKND